jgi:threonine/homoserine/homoserine lactone efflux protein
MRIVAPVISSTHLWAFALTSFALIAAPGPSVLFVITRALVLGRRGALATVLGNAVGVYVQVMAVAFGVGAVVERSIVVFTVIKLGGAAYLVYLGIQAVRHRKALSALFETAPGPSSMRRVLREGFILGIANPKSVVFFAAVLPQFIDRSAGHVPVQLLLLGAVFLAIALVSDTAWALAAGSARSWFERSPRRLSYLGGTGGVVMIGIGTRLAVTGRHD